MGVAGKDMECPWGFEAVKTFKAHSYIWLGAKRYYSKGNGDNVSIEGSAGIEVYNGIRGKTLNSDILAPCNIQ